MAQFRSQAATRTVLRLHKPSSFSLCLAFTACNSFGCFDTRPLVWSLPKRLRGMWLSVSDIQGQRLQSSRAVRKAPAALAAAGEPPSFSTGGDRMTQE